MGRLISPVEPRARRPACCKKLNCRWQREFRLSAEFPFLFGMIKNKTERRLAMKQINTHKKEKSSLQAAKPIGFRYSCGLNGSNTGLSHYILLDKKN
jgi:modified peptide precursor CbpA